MVLEVARTAWARNLLTPSREGRMTKLRIKQMDMQEWLREICRGKRVILVGNAEFSRDRGDFIDSRDLVFRFNQFNRSWFGLNGKRLDCWFNNLVRRGAPWRSEHCVIAKHLNSSSIVGTPHEDDGRLADALAFYLRYGMDLVFPDFGIPTESMTPKQPSTGFYTALRLLQLSIPITLIGFNGGVTVHHDGEAEMAYLRQHPHVTLDMDFS